MQKVIVVSVVVIIGALLGMVSWGAVAAQDIPPLAVVYSGNITIAGTPAPEGLLVVACVGDCVTGWESSGDQIESVTTRPDGSYVGVIIDPLVSSFVGDTISFFIVTDFGERIQAAQSVSYAPGTPISRLLNLTFEDPLPEPPTPTPSPTPPTPPTPTATPILPIPGDSGVPMLGRIAVIAGIVALVIGSGIFIVARRRRAF